jgi:signal transduction histidine kinase
MYSVSTIVIIGTVVTVLLLAFTFLAIRHRTQKWQIDTQNQNARGIQSKIAQAAFEKALHQTSHRLLNPLQRLVAHAEMLNEWQSGQGEAALPYVSSIASAIWTASHQIRRIIGDMADYGRIQQKTLAQHATQVDIAALMAEIHSSTEFPADYKVTVQIARNVPTFICIDRDRFEQIIANGKCLHQ